MSQRSPYQSPLTLLLALALSSACATAETETTGGAPSTGGSPGSGGEPSNGGSGGGGNGVGASSESDREEKPSGRRAAPSTEGGDSGRHRGGDNGQVLSVSELLARERNRSR